MKKTEILKTEYAKLTELKGNLSCIHINTNGGMGGGYFKVVGEMPKNLNAFGMVEVSLPVSKEKIQIHPSWISSIRAVKVFKNGDGFLCELKSIKGNYVREGSMEIHILEEDDSI